MVAKTSAAGISSAFVTGLFIAAYTINDGMGGRLSQGNPVSYAVWLFIIDGLPMLLLYWWRRGLSAPLAKADMETAKAVLGGLVSLIAYASVIWAASITPMGPVFSVAGNLGCLRGF